MALTFDQLLISLVGTTARVQIDLDHNGVADSLDLDGDGVADRVRIDLLNTSIGVLTADFVLWGTRRPRSAPPHKGASSG